MMTSPKKLSLGALHVRSFVVARLLIAVCSAVWFLRPWQASAAEAASKTVRLFTIGASFSKNAVRFLSDIANAAGHKLVLKPAIIAASTLEQHWENAEKAEANPEDPAGKPYGTHRCLPHDCG